MKRLAITMAALLAAASTTAGAQNQNYSAPARQPDVQPRGNTEKPVPATKDAARGMAEAPALLAQTNRGCEVVDAIYRGGGKQKNAEGKNVNTNIYEVGCSDGPGLIILSVEGSAPVANDCLQYATAAAAADPKSKPLTCVLQSNANPYQSLQPIVTKAGSQCSIAKARWTGYSPTALVNLYEVGCSDGGAYVLTAPVKGSQTAVSFDSCMRASSATVTCEYMPPEQVTAAIVALAAPANRANCQATKARFIGATPDRRAFYEVGCADDKAGYIFETDAQNRFTRAIDCAKAGGISGGCTYTNAVVAESEQSGIYTKLVGGIGHPCTVTQYRTIGVDSQKREVAELLCSEAGKSGVAILPTDKGQKGEFFNCVRAAGRSLRCGLVPEAATFGLLTSQVSSKGKSCAVSAARHMGQDATGTDYVEVACSGQPGQVLKYGPGIESVQEVIACTAAKGIGGGCKLPA